MSTAAVATSSATNSATNSPAAAGPRASVLSLAIKEKAALYAAYMPFIKGGGLFVPTSRPAALGDSIYLMLQLMEDPTRLPLQGKVIWVTPAGASGKQQGLGVQFPADASGELAKQKIESLIGGALNAARPTHTI